MGWVLLYVVLSGLLILCQFSWIQTARMREKKFSAWTRMVTIRNLQYRSALEMVLYRHSRFEDEVWPDYVRTLLNSTKVEANFTTNVRTLRAAGLGHWVEGLKDDTEVLLFWGSG